MNTMSRFAVLAATVVACVAAGAEGRSACRLLLDDLEPDVAALDDGITLPPPTKAEMAKVKAVAGSLAAIGKARARRTPDAAAKAGLKIAKLLAKAFPLDAAADAVIQDLADGIPTCLQTEIYSLDSAAALLPPSEGREALQERITAVQSALDDAVYGPFPPADLLKAVKRPAKLLKAAQVRHRKAVFALVGGPGLRTTLDFGFAVHYDASHAEVIADGPPVTTAVGVFSDQLAGLLGDEGQVEVVNVFVDPAAAAPVLPGVYPVDGGDLRVTYGRYDLTTGSPYEVRTFDTGTITILLLEEESGTVAGTFEVSIASNGYTATAGTFRITNFEIGEQNY